MKNLLVMITAVFLLMGCSVIDKIEESPMTSELITNQLTLRFIAGADNPVERAVKLREKLAKIQGDLTEEYTLLELDEKVRAEIDWMSYSMADQELLNFALNKARESISELVSEGVIQPDETATIDTLFLWIDRAAARVR